MSFDLIMTAVGGVFSVLWWLLRQKDEAQQEQIRLLFRKHDDDAAALQELRVMIAQKHYERPELDAKFDRLDQTFREGFRDLGTKFDKLSDTLTIHITKEERR